MLTEKRTNVDEERVRVERKIEDELRAKKLELGERLRMGPRELAGWTGCLHDEVFHDVACQNFHQISALLAALDLTSDPRSVHIRFRYQM